MSAPQNGTMLDTRIREVWRRSQLLHAGAGMLSFFRWAIPLFLVAIVIDRPAYLPGAVRAVILIVLLGVSLYKAWRSGWCELCGFDATRAALQLEKNEGGLESLLVTAIQIREGKVSGDASMCENTRRAAEERAAPLRPEKTVPYEALRLPAVLAGILAVMLAILGLVDGPFLMAGLQRIFTPWVAIDYPTDTHLAIHEGELIIRQGDEATIEIQVSGEVPDQAKLSLQTGTGRARVRTLDITNGVCRYTIASASRDFTYRVHAGDARSDWHEVTVVAAPRIEKARAVLNFAPYLQREPETVSGLTLSVPEETEIEWALTMDSPLRSASLVRDGAEPLPLTLSEDGLHVTLSETAKESRGYRFAWVERVHDFEFSSPRHYLQVAPDQPPSVELTQPSVNLLAILGREVTFKIRARDDHGLAGATLSYRVNLRPKKTKTLTAPLKNGGGDQMLDWDYRAAVTNLQIGDTVAFSIEVQDRYVGTGGAHMARSDTRRITFLSREDYLAEIAKRTGRLLSRVRGIYRQERTAHALVLKLDPNAKSYGQSVQLESARQEMLRGQIGEAVGAVQELIDDLAANGVADAPEGKHLGELHSRLQEIGEKRVAYAAELLRDSANPLSPDEKRDGVAVAHAIDLAARELGRLVLLRDIDSALEVFAREVRAIAQNGAGFMGAVVRYDDGGKGNAHDASAVAALVKEQRELALWTRTLLKELDEGMQYTKRPLGVLTLTRRLKDLRRQGVAAAMDECATLLEKGKVAESMARQLTSVHALLDAESGVRHGVEYTTLLGARDRLSLIQRERDAILADVSRGEAAEGEWVQKLATLREDLAGILLPVIPAPKSRLYDEMPPLKPQVEKLLLSAQRAMAGTDKSTTGSLGELLDIVSARTEDSLVETAGFGKVASAVSEWALRVADFEARQIALLEKADMAAADDKPCAPLAAAQQTLAKDMVRFQSDIRRESDRVKLPANDLAPLLGRLDRVLVAMKAVVSPLQKNKHDDAIGRQEVAADILSDILLRSEAQRERFGMLESLVALERAVRKSTRYVEDIAHEQRDILSAIDKAKPEQLPDLMPIQDNLRQCITDVAPLLDFVAGQMDVGTPLAFTGADMGDAVEALGIKDREEAIDALDAASESMEDVAARMLAMSRQVGYVAEIVDVLNVTLGDATFAAYGQESLVNVMAGDTALPAEKILTEQTSLDLRSVELDQRILRLAGTTTNLTAAAPLVHVATEGLKNADRAASREQMNQAVAVLDQNAAGLLSLVEVLHGLPKLPLTTDTADEERRLLGVLGVASDHHVLIRRTQVADNKSAVALAEQQQKLVLRCTTLAAGGTPHAKLVSAQAHLTQASSLLKSSARDKALVAQNSAGTDLRHFIVEQALVLGTAVPPGAPPDPDAPPSGAPETSGDDLAASIGAVGDFVSGEIPKDQKAEWEVLQQRGRAALHENFARELPLEYRGMLKSYFEGVAK